MKANEVVSVSQQKITNGLSEAVLGQTLTSGFGPGMSIGPQISQVDTLFHNMRWYPISNMRQPLSQAYFEIGVLRNAVDVPVDDAFRGDLSTSRINYLRRNCRPSTRKWTKTAI